jgi:hypothetical protein
MPPLLENTADSQASGLSAGLQQCSVPDPLTGVGGEESTTTSTNPEKMIQSSSKLDDWIDSMGIRLDDSNKKEEEDCRSGYFSKSDFAESNWTDAAGYIPPISFAVVAGGVAIFAPVTFLLGTVAAFTTVGTVRAAVATYEFCVDSPCCGVSSQEQETDAGAVPAIREGVSQITFTMDEEESLESFFDKPEEGDIASVRSVHGQDPAVLQTRKEVTDWVQLYYPVLKHTARENMEFVGLNALEFFEVFFDNDAPYTLKEFQSKRGDKDIQYGQWEKLDHVQQPSLHAKAKSCPDLPSLVRDRVLTFKVKNISYFGPPYVPATKVQRALVASKRLLVLESKNTVSDVPFCDRFFVLERWVVTAEKMSDGLYHLNASIYSQAFFTKKCTFESQIVSKSESSFKDISKQWHIMAQEGLKLTEKSRSKRIRRKQKAEGLDDESVSQHDPEEENDLEHDFPEDESVEVRHLGRCKSWVVGDGDEPDLESTLSRRSSFGIVSRSISKLFVRKQSSETLLPRLMSQSALEGLLQPRPTSQSPRVL